MTPVWALGAQILAWIVGLFVKPKTDPTVLPRTLGQDEQKLVQVEKDNATLAALASTPPVADDPGSLRASDPDSRD